MNSNQDCIADAGLTDDDVILVPIASDHILSDRKTRKLTPSQSAFEGCDRGRLTAVVFGRVEEDDWPAVNLLVPEEGRLAKFRYSELRSRFQSICSISEDTPGWHVQICGERELAIRVKLSGIAGWHE